MMFFIHEGPVRKGGQNKEPSEVVTRPDKPSSMSAKGKPMTDTGNPSIDALRQRAKALRTEASLLDDRAAHLRKELEEVEKGARKRRDDAAHMEATADQLSPSFTFTVTREPDSESIANLKNWARSWGSPMRPFDPWAIG